jgi:hypothetical protein
MSDTQDFRLSRIYAQGWAAATPQWTKPGDDGRKAANPYTTEPERTRWDTGFANARKGRHGT